MEWLWVNIKRFFKVFFSYAIALARLVNWTLIFFFAGLQRTLFMRSEVTNVDFCVMPLRCDMEETDDKLAYIDKLCIENPDLIEAVCEEEIPFDDIMDEEIKPDDEDNGEDKE